MLLQPRDLPLEFVDVRWGSEPGFLPRLGSQRLRQPFLQLLDAGGQAGVAGLGVGEVGLERGPADRRAAGRVLSSWFAFGRVASPTATRTPTAPRPVPHGRSPRHWHLVLTDVQELALPIPAGGQLGPWKPTPDLLSQVLQQLPDLRP